MTLQEVDLDYILEKVQSLKDNNGRACTVENVWNDPTVGRNPAKAKLALLRMKSVIKTLGVLTKSLESRVQHLFEEASPGIYVEGFASLPDELLARIFELVHQDHLNTFDPDPDWSDIPSTPGVALTLVCKRFKRIVQRLPALWEIVVLGHDDEEIKLLKSKCQSPRVFITANADMSNGYFVQFLKQAPAPPKWKELVLEYYDDDTAVSVFNAFKSTSKTSFPSMTSLTISSQGYDTDDDEPPQLFPDACREAFKDWELPKLSSLFLTNVIPNPRFTYRELTYVSITLGKVDIPGGIYKWNMEQLGSFILSLETTLQTLEVKFRGAGTLNRYIDVGEVRYGRQLSALTTLSLEVAHGTVPIVLTQFVEMVDMPKLANLDIDISWTKPDEPEKYLEAIFKPSAGAIRVFPHVRKATLQIRNHGGLYYPATTVFRALPRLSSLSLTAPGFQTPNLFTCKDEFGCFEDLRVLRIDNCASHHGAYLVNFFGHPKSRAMLERFEVLELEGCCGMLKQRCRLHSLLGDKLIWKN